MRNAQPSELDGGDLFPCMAFAFLFTQKGLAALFDLLTEKTNMGQNIHSMKV